MAGFVVDHLVPRSKGGGETFNNLVCCCEQCNAQKYNKSVLEFLWWVRFKRRNLSFEFAGIAIHDETPRDWLLVYSSHYAPILARQAGNGT
jgi:hypothetical protein